METNRKAYIDYIKVLGIVLVILGHINFANQTVKDWIYAFHMPLFFFAAGLVLKPTQLNPNYLEKKFTQLIIPYLLWGIIYSSLDFRNIARILYGSYHAIVNAESLSSLWFLPTMFLAVIICQIILHITEKNIAIGVFAVILFLIGVSLPQLVLGYPWCIDVSMLAAAFILVGYLAKNRIDEFSKWGGCQIFYLLTLVGFLFSLMYMFNPINVDSYVLMAERRFGNLLLFVIAAVGGCIFVTGLSIILTKINGVVAKYLSFVGRNTLVIFAVQKPIISLCGKAFSLIYLPVYIELMVTAAMTLICSCVLCVFVNRYAPCLAGRR